MGKSGEAFLQIREIQNLSYDHTFTKKQAIAAGTKLAADVVESGELDLFTVAGNLARLSEVVNAALAEIRKADALFDIQGKEYKQNGVRFSVANTGDRMDYGQDPIYADLAKKLKQREDLLKHALKSDLEVYSTVYDEETGEEFAGLVPKVGVKTYGKTIVKIEY